MCCFVCVHILKVVRFFAFITLTDKRQKETYFNDIATSVGFFLDISSFKKCMTSFVVKNHLLCR